MSLYRDYIKRYLDILCAAIALILLSPIFLLVMLLVRIKLGSPVLFRQPRPGKDGKIFLMYKFRSMTEEKDMAGKLLPDDKRLTKFGRWLRASSLDELPELFNILKGDMSFVGPRPQLVRDMVFMTEEQNRRHEVRQGLTGLAQVNGRNAINWEEKLGYDVKYVAHITFFVDVIILGKTLHKVFVREGIHADAMETAEDYGDYLLRTGKISMEVYEKKQRQAQELIIDAGKQ